MSHYEKESHNRVRRVANRGVYDEDIVHRVIDEAYVAHVGFTMDDRPFVIPMLHAREGRTLYLHASTKSRFYKVLATSIPVCVTITHVDGIVIARSAFNHSMNYRSAVAHGHCQSVGPEEKAKALELFTDKILPGRWDECRPVHQKEIDVTGVLAFTIEAAAAKIRTGPPSDDADDYGLPIWAGVIPIETNFGNIIPDPAMKEDLAIPDSVKKVTKTK